MLSRWFVRPAMILTIIAGCGVPESESPEALRSTSLPVVGGEPSTAADDFVVLVTRTTTKGSPCAGALVAPNLVLTAKHCVYEYDNDATMICDASGEPQVGSAGGIVTGTLPLEQIAFYTGADARKRQFDNQPPSAFAKEIVDDETKTLCSHDLAYVVLDRALTGVRIAPMRLARRPAAGDAVAVAGWGEIENRTGPLVRFRRAGMAVQRVGSPAPQAGATGTLGPRSFETGPAGCEGDSGAPGFDATTNAVFGVLVRARNLDSSHQVSPCAPDTVLNVYMTVADFVKPLRAAFAAAGAQPRMEGRGEPGYLHFGDACTSNLECEGELCDGASEQAAGTCNIACSVPGRSCPVGYACSASGKCEVPPPPSEEPPPEEPPAAPPPDVRPSGGCSSAPHGSAPRGSGPPAAIFLACAAAASRIRRPRRHL